MSNHHRAGAMMADRDAEWYKNAQQTFLTTQLKNIQAVIHNPDVDPMVRQEMRSAAVATHTQLRDLDRGTP
jgi:hypothetical protein